MTVLNTTQKHQDVLKVSTVVALTACHADIGSHNCNLPAFPRSIALGEVYGMRSMYDIHQYRAATRGAKIFHCCGINCLPDDDAPSSCKALTLPPSFTSCEVCWLRIMVAIQVTPLHCLFGGYHNHPLPYFGCLPFKFGW